MSAGSRFRDVLAKKGLVEAMASHSPLSAMLVAEAGFDAIWASGFELSAMYGVPDVSIVTMTQHLDMMRAMAERSGIPVVADIDTGFGNAINVLYAIEQYERAGVAAIVMEDKSFPKVTSLIAGGRQDMVRIEEFQGKIEAARAARPPRSGVQAFGEERHHPVECVTGGVTLLVDQMLGHHRVVEVQGLGTPRHGGHVLATGQRALVEQHDTDLHDTPRGEGAVTGQCRKTRWTTRARRRLF